jgi:3-oxo-5alpha-steroid 4-dehydrogenase
MLAYMRAEVAGDGQRGEVVDEATLRRFCADSAANLRWLEGLGAQFRGSLCPYKTNYPTDRHFLYYSGSEKASRFAAIAKPAPRGHHTVGTGVTGVFLWRAVFNAAIERGVRFEARPRLRTPRISPPSAREVVGEAEAPQSSPSCAWPRTARSARRS